MSPARSSNRKGADSELLDEKDTTRPMRRQLDKYFKKNDKGNRDIVGLQEINQNDSYLDESKQQSDSRSE